MPFAQLTNLGKHTFIFDPASIFAVNVQPGPDGPHTTFVWTVFNQPQSIAGNPVDFLNLHGLTTEFAKLSGPRGELWVKADAVGAMHIPWPGDQQPANVNCILSVAGAQFVSLEDVSTVRQLLEAILNH